MNNQSEVSVRSPKGTDAAEQCGGIPSAGPEQPSAPDVEQGVGPTVLLSRAAFEGLTAKIEALTKERNALKAGLRDVLAHRYGDWTHIAERLLSNAQIEGAER